MVGIESSAKDGSKWGTESVDPAWIVPYVGIVPDISANTRPNGVSAPIETDGTRRVDPNIPLISKIIARVSWVGGGIGR